MSEVEKVPELDRGELLPFTRLNSCKAQSDKHRNHVR